MTVRIFRKASNSVTKRGKPRPITLSYDVKGATVTRRYTRCKSGITVATRRARALMKKNCSVWLMFSSQT